MSWWGKVVGGALGFMLGGPLGALLGASLGHSLDSGMAGRRGQDELLEQQSGQQRTQAAFFTATFSIMGCLAKADGRVSAPEISLVEALIREMRLDSLQRKAAIELFNQGKRRGFDLHGVLEQFRAECHWQTTLLQMFLEIQVQAACADGRLNAAERRMLEDIAARLGVRRPDLDSIIDRIQGTRRSSRPEAFPAADPYKVLGVTRDTPTAEIRRAYRRLLSQHHPDKLVSKGLPEEMIRLANQQTHEIRAAWQAIQDERGKTG